MSKLNSKSLLALFEHHRTQALRTSWLEWRDLHHQAEPDKPTSEERTSLDAQVQRDKQDVKDFIARRLKELDEEKSE